MQTRIIVGILLIVGLVGYLAFIGYGEGRSYYLTCDEAAGRLDELRNNHVRLAGNVVDGSIRRDGDILTFELEYQGAKFPVRYVGIDPVPDTFKDGADAVVEGTLDGEGIFQGKRIQAKCASKYEADYNTEPKGADSTV